MKNNYSNIKKLFIVLLSLFTINTTTSAQDSLNMWDHTTHLKLVNIEQGNSYMTTPWDIGNIEDLVFEGNLNPSFVVRENDRAHLMLVITPQIIIRMFNTRSLPVKTPSYMPHVTLFYSIGNPKARKMHSVFLRYEHHSNGQQGPTYLTDGTINVDSGDFTTNFIEPGFIRAMYCERFKKVLFMETSFEYHFRTFTQPEILGKYGLYKLKTRVSLVSPPQFFHKKGDFQIDTKLDWTFGELNEWKPFNYKRLSLELTFFYRPKFLEEVGVFVTYYMGMDYYNIYFNQHLSVLRFGLMTPFLRF